MKCRCAIFTTLELCFMEAPKQALVRMIGAPRNFLTTFGRGFSKIEKQQRHEISWRIAELILSARDSDAAPQSAPEESRCEARELVPVQAPDDERKAQTPMGIWHKPQIIDVISKPPKAAKRFRILTGDGILSTRRKADVLGTNLTAQLMGDPPPERSARPNERTEKLRILAQDLAHARAKPSLPSGLPATNKQNHQPAPLIETNRNLP